ncbi:MAG TPA: hypothetical protein VK879_13195, partial [Candidatus Sulfomarinibacteraceae bacterium]|nr:hypothetical protein [Candidatus Sulfomarinibacteraceae bacterium]
FSKVVFGAGLATLAAYALRKKVIARWFDLPPAQYRVSVRHNLRVPMPEGVTLAADHYAPAVAAQGTGLFPTVLIRTPYGKALAPRFHPCVWRSVVIM